MLNLLENFSSSNYYQVLPIEISLTLEKIIHGCIKLLFTAIFKNAKEDRETMEMNCELLCKLLNTIGALKYILFNS